VIHKDYIHRRGEKRVLRDLIPAIKEFESNIDFPRAIFNQLKRAKISEEDGRLVVDVPRVSLKKLGGDEFMLWVVGNRMDLIQNESLVCDKATIRMPGKAFAGGRFSLNLGAINDDECIVVNIGVNSFRDGKWQKVKGKNGFVILAY
jgi:hypothetical protein